MKILTSIWAGLTFCLIFVGALVKSHDAGLSVPDWPQSYGYNMFTFPISMWIGGILYEHGHRLFASGVGLLTLILTIWIWLKEDRKALRILATCALIAVVLQGVLGGLTVWFGLPLLVSTAHALLAQTFFLITIAIAYFYSTIPSDEPIPSFSLHRSPIVKFAIFAILAIYIQLLFGALMRHAEAGLAIPDFPTIGNEWFPRFDDQMFTSINGDREKLHLLPVTYQQIILHLLHRYWAFGVFIIELFLILKLFKQSSFRFIGLLLSFLLIVQIVLGIYTVWTGRDPWIASLHLALGAALLGFTFLVFLKAGLTISDSPDLLPHEEPVR